MEHRRAIVQVKRTRTQLREIDTTGDKAIDDTAERLEAAAQDAGYWVSADGRVGETDVAAMIGLTPGSLANRRREGTAPMAYAIGGRGHRVTYRIIDVARWIEAHRDR
ncbi:helix-turn-helix transcriptional regulator [Luteimonas sp. A478]